MRRKIVNCTLLCILCVLCLIGSGCGNKKQELKLPDSKIANMLPQLDSNYGEIKFESEDALMIEVNKISKEQFEAYIEECKNRGFEVDFAKFESLYTANHADGYSLMLTYNESKKTLNISVDTIDNNTEATENTVTTLETEVTELTTSDEPTTDTTTSEQTVPEPEMTTTTISEEIEQKGIRAEFKSAMDSYEAFFDEYIAFMEKYASSEDKTNMLSDYSDYMTKYVDTMKKMNELGEEELSTDELLYYTEVSTRISQKLLKVSMTIQ